MPSEPNQHDALDWCEKKGYRTDLYGRSAKLVEEAAEALAAVIKMEEGRKTLTDLAQETAQTVICAMALAEAAGFDLNEAVQAEWDSR